MLLKREINLIERYTNSKTDSTLAIRITPIGKRLVMFREIVEEKDGFEIIDCQTESQIYIGFKLTKEQLIEICEEQMK